MRKAFLLFITLTFGLQLCFSQDAVIIGNLKPIDSSDVDITKDIYELWLDGENGSHAYATINPDFTFKFENLREGLYTLIIPAFIKQDTYRISLKNNQKFKIEIPISYYCEYDKSENDKTCPECKKTDKSIPIIYGLFGGNGKDNWSGGCLKTGCDPNWYCKRDKTKF